MGVPDNFHPAQGCTSFQLLLLQLHGSHHRPTGSHALPEGRCEYTRPHHCQALGNQAGAAEAAAPWLWLTGGARRYRRKATSPFPLS